MPGRELPESGGESDVTPKGSFKTPKGLVADAGKSHSPAATLFR